MTEASAPRPAPPGPVAYLVSEYPALSHTFIENEVDALRAVGWCVETFSVRPTSLTQHPEHATTEVLQAGGAKGLLRAAGRALLRRPHAAARGAGAALAHGRGRSLRARVWQGFYLLEALVLHDAMQRQGLRWVHVHFANNSADIARLAVVIGDAVDGPGTWRWSLSVHGPTEFERAEEFDLAAKVGQAAFVACITDYCRSQLMRFTPPGAWEKLQVVRMGLPPSQVPAPEVDRSTRQRDAPLRVLFVGRLVAEKGPHVLLDAIDALAREEGSPLLDVVLVGAGPLEASLRARTSSMADGVTVRFTGGLPRAEITPWYQWADVFCLPSFAEGLPVVLMEALAARLPVVTTPIAGIPELVVDGESGVLVTPGRADLLARALRRLAEDPAAAARLAEHGASHVKARHDARRNGILLGDVLAERWPHQPEREHSP